MMCRVFTAQNPERFAKVSRSVRISGHSTSVRLESAFWDALEDMAEMEGMSTSKLIAELCNEARDLPDVMSNLSSMLRTVCVLYLEQRTGRVSIHRKA
jgi:predicted DNA-binding ribbon-helix-helix protein